MVRRTTSRGFTLLELVLTLGVLIVMASLFWPILIGWSEGAVLDRGADDLRGLLTGLRLRAIQQGKRFRINFLPQESTFTIEVEGEQPATTATVSTLPTSTTKDELKAQQTESFPRYYSQTLIGQHSLPSGLIIADPGLSEQTANASTQQSNGAVTIEFRPDGTTTDTAFLLVDEQQVARLFRIRGLTGSITVDAPVNTGVTPSIDREDASP